MWCGVVPGWAPLPLIAEIFSFPFPNRLGFIFESWSWGAVRRPYLVFLGRGLCPGFWLWAQFVSGAVALGAVCVRGLGFGRGLCPVLTLGAVCVRVASRAEVPLKGRSPS